MPSKSRAMDASGASASGTYQEAPAREARSTPQHTTERLTSRAGVDVLGASATCRGQAQKETEQEERRKSQYRKARTFAISDGLVA